MATHEIKADLDVDGEVQGTSLDINGNADISGNLTGLDNVTSTNFIIGGHTINDVDITSEDSNADDHLMTSKAIVNLIADNENSFLTSVPNHSGNLITTGTVAAARVATLNQNTTGSSGSCTGNSATATDATNLNATDDRDMAPEDYGYSNDFRIFFTSKEGLEDGSSTSGNWMDALYLNSYSDASGHDANLLAFDKSTKAIYHYQADQAATNWGTAKQLAYTDSDISGDTTGTAAIATTITVADESSDTSCNVLFATAATGNLAPKSGTNLTFNSSSGVLTATGFAGALTGNVTGNCSGTAATVTGAAQSSITSLGTLTTLTVDNVIINGTTIGHTSDTDLLTLSSGTLVVAGNIECADIDISGTATGDGSGLDTLNASNISSGTLAAARVATLNQNTTGSSGSCTGNAATATTAALATQSTIVANNSANETCYPVFVDGATGAQGLETDTGWTFNPSTGTLTTQKIATDVASIVENNKDGSALMTLTGQGAGNESNISLKMVGTSNGNPIKMKMVALDDSGSQVGAGLLSYDAEDDSFGIGQSSSHNRMAIKMENTITSPVDGSTYVYYEPTSIKAREYVASSNSSHYDFNGDIMRNGNDTTVRGKLYVFKNGTWTITNADTKLDSNGLLGFALGTNSTTHGMLLKGTFTLDYDPGGAGNPLYISTTDGVVSTTVPSTSGHIVRLIGYLIGGSHGNVFFDPDKTYVEVA